MSQSQAHPARVTTTKMQDIVVIEIGGRLTVDSGACEQLRTAIEEALESGERLFVIDLESVSKIDSSGFGELVAAYNRVSGNKGALAMANPTSRILRYLSVHMMDLSLGGGPFDSVKAAVDSLRKQGQPAPQDKPQ